MYPWQAAALECGEGGANLVYCAPTSGGKSLVAEVLLLRRLLAASADTWRRGRMVCLPQRPCHLKCSGTPGGKCLSGRAAAVPPAGRQLAGAAAQAGGGVACPMVMKLCVYSFTAVLCPFHM